MATANNQGVLLGFLAGMGAVAGPFVAQIAVLLTTAGHTANFREMNAARGWITSVGYGLHAAYLFSIAFSILLAPTLRRWASSYTLAKLGLSLLAVGSLLNGLDVRAAYELAVFGRILAGFGAGQAMSAIPRLLPAARPRAVDSFEIVLPSFGPIIIAGASISYGWSDWEGAFLFEGILAIIGLACIVPLNPDHESPASVPSSIAYLPTLAVGVGCLWWLLVWGHLNGGARDRTVLLVAFGGVIALIVALWLAWPSLTFELVRDAFPRAVLVTFAGMVQFFQVSETGIFGGLFINVSELDRAWQVWPLGIGAAMSLLLGRMVWKTAPPGRFGSAIGFLLIAAGMAYAHSKMLGWPFWNVLNVVEFNWFAAPQTWEMAPGRFLMGFGFGLVILSETHRAGRDPILEPQIEVGLRAAQFIGGGIGIGVLCTALLAGHQWEYSYAADRGSIQPTEVSGRTKTLQSTFAASGSTEAARQADVLMFRSVNYQSDALVFADVYAGFGLMSAVLAIGLFGQVIWNRLVPLWIEANPECQRGG